MEPVEKCSVDGCANKTKRNGWCWMHFMRHRRTGSVDTVRLPGVDAVFKNEKECSQCRAVFPIGEFLPCVVTGKRGPKHSAQAYCKSCRGLHAIAYRKRLKQQVIMAYGGQCVCCGESAMEFLTIDHIFNDGSVHRKAINAKGSTALYSWLRTNKYPKDRFRCLCMNCNFSRGIHGYCPHEKKEAHVRAQ